VSSANAPAFFSTKKASTEIFAPRSRHAAGRRNSLLGEERLHIKTFDLHERRIQVVEVLVWRQSNGLLDGCHGRYPEVILPHPAAGLSRCMLEAGVLLNDQIRGNVCHGQLPKQGVERLLLRVAPRSYSAFSFSPASLPRIQWTRMLVSRTIGSPASFTTALGERPQARRRFRRPANSRKTRRDSETSSKVVRAKS
jgi:hypothetical protein